MKRIVNKEAVEKNTLFLTVTGSHAYGTNTPESDYDYAGVCLIPWKEYLYGIKRFDQMNNWTDENGEKVDKTIFNLNKFVSLLQENNPNIVDYTFVPERCIVKTTKYWERIRDNIDLFISKKCKHSYSGYAFSQLERIKTHKSYLLNPVPKPERKNYGLPETSVFPQTQIETIAKLSYNYIPEDNQVEFFNDVSQFCDKQLPLILRNHMANWMVPLAIEDFKKNQLSFYKMLSSISSIYIKDEFKDAAQKELSYLAAYKNWKRYKDWEKGRNPKRSAIEKKCGFDGKHFSHAIRLTKMAKEILEGKGVIVDRTGIDAEFLLEIRNGEWKYEDLMDIVNNDMKEIEEIYQVSTLQHSPQEDKITELFVSVVEEYCSNHQ